jgi:SAM-dependent methyltransferase
MSLFDRRITVWLNWGFDNLLPPFLRDNLLCMGLPMRLCLGKKWREFAQFKERASALTADEMDETYRCLASSHLPRETDLHPATIQHLRQRVLGGSVLDVGCGRGYLSRLLQRELGIEVVGIDIVPPCEDTGGDFLRFCQGRAESLPFADGSFDTVICAHTLEHTVKPQAVISELRRVARKRLIVVVPCQRPYRYTFDLHVQFFPYPYSLDLLMGTDSPTTKNIGGEFYYEEDIS